MDINTNTGSVITLTEAITYVTAFRNKYPSMAKAFFVGTEKLSLITQQADCIGIRIYNGYNEIDQMMNLVLVGVKSNGEDLTDGIILEKLAPCPSICSVNSPLNI